MFPGQKNIFTGGLNLDQDPRNVPANQLTDANDISIVSSDAGDSADVIPLHSSSAMFTVPDIAAQPQWVRLIYGGAVAHTFQIYDTEGNQITALFSITPANYGALKTAIQSAVLPYGTMGASFAPGGSLTAGDAYIMALTLGVDSTPFAFNIVATVGGEDITVYTVQDAFLAASEMRQLQNLNLDGKQFVVSESTDGEVAELGIATEDQAGTWTYTRLLHWTAFAWPTDQIIDMRGEPIANDFWAIYITDFTNKPKTFYVPKTYSADCMQKYTVTTYSSATTYGYVTLESVDQITDLQLTNSMLHIVFKEQKNSGGALTAGGKGYAVRCGINGTKNVTEWSFVTPNAIPVFKASTDSPLAYINIQGDPSGTPTTKVNILTVKNAKPGVFNFVEVACIEYAGYNTAVATSAFIVGRFDITAEDFDIQHTGLETNSEPLDTGLLPRVEDVILRSKRLEIKKNRLNLLNNVLATDDAAFTDIAEAITIDNNGLTALDNVGSIGATPGINTIAATRASNVTLPYVIPTTIVFDSVSQNTSPATYNGTTGVWTPDGTGIYIFSVNVSYEFIFPLGGQRVNGQMTGRIINVSDNITEYVTNIFYSNSPADNTVPIVFSAYINATGGKSYRFEIIQDIRLVGGGAPPTTNALAGATLGISTISVPGVDFSNTVAAEYQQPENCANKVGYMVNEPVLLYFCPHFKSGYIGSPVYIGTYTATALDTYLGAEFQLLYTSALTQSTLIYNPVLGNIDISSVRDQLEGFSIWRGITVPVVLGSGVYFTQDGAPSGQKILTGYYQSAPLPVGATGMYGSTYSNVSDVRYWGMFVSPDLRDGYSFGEGDKLHVFGAPRPVTVNNSFQSGLNKGSFVEFNGYKIGHQNQYESNIVDATNVDFGNVADSDVFNPALGTSGLGYKWDQSVGNGHSQMRGIGMTTEDRITNSSNSYVATADNGLSMAQIIRPQAVDIDVYSIPVTPTGTYYKITAETPDIINNISVYGGDTYTQKNILRTMYWTNWPTDYTKFYSAFITYYAQSRINTQLEYNDTSNPQETWNLQGWKYIQGYLFPFTTAVGVVENQYAYDNGYSAANILSRGLPYNSDFPQNGNIEATILYSQQKPVNSVYDFYRKFLPEDKRDLEAKYGPGVAMYDLNDNMAVVQPDAVTMLPYDANAAITDASNGNQVYIGSGGVYAARETIVSTYGSNIGTSVLLAKNRNGNPQLYWISPRYKRFMRYGADGIFIPSETENVSSWLANNLTFAENEFDLVLGYDIFYRQIAITSRCQNDTVALWTFAASYLTGDKVKISGENNYINLSTFEQFPDIYTALNNNNSNPVQDNPTIWQLVPHTNNSYYNEWTLLYSQDANKFTSFATFRPDRYFNFNGEMVAPRGISPYGKSYLLYRGEGYLQWFDHSGAYQQGTWSVQVAVNVQNDVNKKMIGLAIQTTQDHDTDNNPTVELTTETQTSGVVSTRLKLEYDQLKGGFPTDTNKAPVINTIAKVKMYGQEYIKLLSVTTFFRWVKNL